MQIRPAARPKGSTSPWPGMALALAMLLALLSVSTLAPARALAGQIHESDLVISSKVGKVASSAEGDNVKATTTVHSVDIKSGSRTGEVTVSGQAGQVTTRAGGQNTSADSAIGGVNVGAKQ